MLNDSWRTTIVLKIRLLSNDVKYLRHISLKGFFIRGYIPCNRG